MFLSPRQEEILSLAKSSGVVRVDDLVEHFDVTPQTIRRDLNALCDERHLARIHGGAVMPSSRENVEYEARRRVASEEKALIGEATAREIPDGASLFINIGTTTEAVSDSLHDHTGLMVITNNINVANSLRVHPTNEVIIASGVVRPSDGGIVGEAAVDFINQFKVDFAVIGASAIDEDGGLFDFDFREVKVAQAIMANARHVVLVADSGKFTRSASVRIGDVSDIDTFVTDHCPSRVFRRACQDAGVRLLETS